MQAHVHTLHMYMHTKTYTHTRTHIHIHTHIQTHTYVYTHVKTYIHMYTQTHTHKHIDIQKPCIHVHIHTYTHVHPRLCKYAGTHWYEPHKRTLKNYLNTKLCSAELCFITPAPKCQSSNPYELWIWKSYMAEGIKVGDGNKTAHQISIS